MKHIEEKPDISQSKREIRKKMLSIRDRIPTEDRMRYDKKIRETVTCMAEYQEAEIILAYANYRSEVDTTGLIQQALAEGKAVFVPKVDDGDMEFWQITAVEDLQKGYKGIPEPLQTISFPEWLMRTSKVVSQSNESIIKVMMWMPGAAFDRERHRIGYGGGFYDRYLERMADWKMKNYEKSIIFDLTTVALAYDCQVSEYIPHEQHDIRPDKVVTETGIY